LLPRLRLPSLVETALAVLLLDYTLYIWHVLTHKVPLLWRLHRVHHSDLDLSASTALRFHFVEMIVSAPWRAAQVVLIGVSPRQLSLWQTLTTMAILFHHSNTRLPLAIERALARVVVTPRMHGIHHSIVERETDSNWGTIFSLPDYLHRTVRLNVPQQACPSRSSARAGGSGLRAEARPSRTVAGERLAAHRMTGTMALWRAADLCSRRSSIAARLTRAMPRCMQDSFRAA
jgi:sterol desaturase/sphingolipid hydroxylase (fatty acid hydroxylase superfamily)